VYCRLMLAASVGLLNILSYPSLYAWEGGGVWIGSPVMSLFALIIVCLSAVESVAVRSLSVGAGAATLRSALL